MAATPLNCGLIDVIFKLSSSAGTFSFAKIRSADCFGIATTAAGPWWLLAAEAPCTSWTLPLRWHSRTYDMQIHWKTMIPIKSFVDVHALDAGGGIFHCLVFVFMFIGNCDEA